MLAEDEETVIEGHEKRKPKYAARNESKRSFLSRKRHGKGSDDYHRQERQQGKRQLPVQVGLNARLLCAGKTRRAQ